MRATHREIDGERPGTNICARMSRYSTTVIERNLRRIMINCPIEGHCGSKRSASRKVSRNIRAHGVDRVALRGATPWCLKFAEQADIRTTSRKKPSHDDQKVAKPRLKGFHARPEPTHSRASTSMVPAPDLHKAQKSTIPQRVFFSGIC